MLHFLRANAWVVVLLAAAVGAALFLVDPAPPREVVLATGPEGGAYHAFGERLADRLAHDGLAVRLHPTEGAVDNLRLLQSDSSDVALALVQSGVSGDPDSDSGLRSLGSLFHEPLWLFSRREQPIDTVRDLRGKRVAVGNEGSGTLPVATRVLELNGLLADGPGQARILKVGGDRALEALRDGTADAAFFVAAPRSPFIRRLIADPGLDFHGLRRVRAYASAFPRLTTVTIGEGQLDLARDIPPEDRTLLSAVVTLVANERFHPGLAPLVLEAASDLLREGGALERPGDFPRPLPVDFPLLAEAKHYHRYGPPFLMRYLPFWAATVAMRVFILCIPLAALLIPLVRVAPPVYRWRTRRRIFQWYRHLREVDQRLRSGVIRDTVDDDLRRLHHLEDEVLAVKVPLSYADELYNLHLHIEWVIRRLERLRDEQPGPGHGAEAGAT